MEHLELCDDDCVGTFMLGCAATHSHALLYVDTAAENLSSSSSSKKRKPRSDFERLVALVATQLFGERAAAKSRTERAGGVRVTLFDAARCPVRTSAPPKSEAWALEDPPSALDCQAEDVFDALCSALLRPHSHEDIGHCCVWAPHEAAEAEPEPEPAKEKAHKRKGKPAAAKTTTTTYRSSKAPKMMFVDERARTMSEEEAAASQRRLDELLAEEAQFYDMVFVTNAEQLLFASDVFAAHLAGLLRPSRRRVRQQGTWHQLRDDVRPFSVVFVVADTSPYTGPARLPDCIMDEFLFGARLSPALFENAAVEAIHASIVSMRHQMDEVYAGSEVLFYLRELVVRLRQHVAFAAGLATPTYAAFETAAKVAALVDGCLYVTPVHVQSVATMALRHRLVLKPPAEVAKTTTTTTRRERKLPCTTEHVIAEVLTAAPVPV